MSSGGSIPLPEAGTYMHVRGDNSSYQRNLVSATVGNIVNNVLSISLGLAVSNLLFINTKNYSTATVTSNNYPYFDVYCFGADIGACSQVTNLVSFSLSGINAIMVRVSPSANNQTFVITFT